ncbi:serine hydrolase [Sphingomonas sp. 1P06PA]|uniref:serine hydrolase domain-containing protein n=1 Tax=Sphingomonas sp. 1P06PA TaxID=554121 RepID=UPI0039A53D21
MMRRLALILALVSGTAQAAEPTVHDRAIAAGYKALFLCNGLFVAGQSEAAIGRDDLAGAYPAMQPLVDALPARIDRAGQTVRVAFADAMPARIAARRGGFGCVLAPAGAANDSMLPTIAPLPLHDARAWPMGDNGATAMLPPARRATLDARVKLAFGADYGADARTSAVLVLKGDHIVAEQYRAGYDRHTPQRTWSVGKSIAATLIGRAAQLGILSVDDPVGIPEWGPGDPRGAIRIRHLMHMASGLYSEGPGNRSDDIYFGGSAVAEKAGTLPLEAAPGTRWNYANNDTLLAVRALEVRLGDRAPGFPQAELFARLGMTRTFAGTDWRGTPILSSQIWTTARDLARLALLYRANGMWAGERLLPVDWTRFVSTAAPAQPPAGREGYGAFFWLFGPDQGLPAGTYAMNGNRGQYVMIVPARDLIVIRRGFDPIGGTGFDIARFARDVVAALD